MGVKLLWTGLVFIIALVPALNALGLAVSNVVVLVGAFLMLVGLVFLWADK